MKQPQWFLLLIILSFPVACRESSFSTTNENVNSEDTIIVDGESFLLADLGFELIAKDTYHFADDFYSSLSKLNRNLKSWGLVSAKFFSESIFNSEINYQFVGTLPVGCESHDAISCSKDNVIYLIPKHYVKLSPSEKMSTILHLHLHAWESSVSHQTIAAFLRAVPLFQELVRTKHRPRLLTQIEVDLLDAMYSAGYSLKMGRGNGGYIIFAQGGGSCRMTLQGECSIGEGSFLNIGSFVDNIKIGRNSVLLDVTAPSHYPGDITVIGDRVRASHYHIDATIGNDVTLIGDPYSYQKEIVGYLDGPLTIRNSNVTAHLQALGPITIENSWFYQHKPFEMPRDLLPLNSGSVIKDSTVNIDSRTEDVPLDLHIVRTELGNTIILKGGLWAEDSTIAGLWPRVHRTTLVRSHLKSGISYGMEIGQTSLIDSTFNVTGDLVFLPSHTEARNCKIDKKAARVEVIEGCDIRVSEN